MNQVIKEIEVKDVKAKVREDTSDEFVVNEVIRGNEYRKLNLQPSDVVLDFAIINPIPFFIVEKLILVRMSIILKYR